MQRATGNGQQAPDFMQHTANTKRHATQQTTCNRQHPDNMQRVIYSEQQTTCKMGTGNMRQHLKQHAATNTDMQRNMQRKT
jgi:hypothetical protein